MGGCRARMMAVVALLATLIAAPAAGARDPSIQRVSGLDRYATAAAISRVQFPSGAEDVFLATGENFADALAVGPVAAGFAPVLLTAKDRLPDATRQELQRLRPRSLIVVGGPAAISDAVYDEASSFASEVFEVAGETRYDTAVALSVVFDNPFAVYLASGVSFPDALSGGALAGVVGAPVLLVPPTGPAPDVVRQRICALAPEVLVVLGGEAAVSQETVADAAGCAGSIERIQGPDRFATSAAISVDNEYSDTVVIATGHNFPDGLAGGGLAAARGGPLLLVEQDRIPFEVGCEIRRLEPETIFILGGPTAVSQSVEDQLRQRDLPGPQECPPDRTVTRPIRFDGLVPGDAVMAPDGRTAWVVDRTQDALHQFDLVERRLAVTIAVGPRPGEIALLGDGRIAVVNGGPDRTITLVDPSDRSSEVIDLSDDLQDGETLHGVTRMVDGQRLAVSTSIDGGGRLLLVDLEPPADGGPLPLPGDPPSRVADEGPIETGVELVTAPFNGLVIGVSPTSGSGEVVVFDPQAEGDERLQRVATPALGRTIAIDERGETWLLDGQLVVRDRGQQVDSIQLDEPFVPVVGVGAVAPDAVAAWTRGGTALLTVDLRVAAEPVEATFVPRLPLPSEGRQHTLVSDDAARAALVQEDVIWVVDGLDQELERGLFPNSGGGRSAASDAMVTDPVAALLGREARRERRHMVSTTLP